MGHAKIYELGTFPDLRRRLEEQLDTIRSLPDLEKLLQTLIPIIKDGHFSAEERGILRRLRQRAYDRKRHPKFQTMAQISEPIQMQIPDLETPKITQPAGESTTMNNFTEGALKAITSIDGERFVKTTPKLLAWFISASLVSYLLWQQSLALYESADFGDTIITAIGGIVMIAGFAAYYSITRSWLAMLMCLYAVGYESYLMVSGTMHDDQQSQINLVQQSPELIFLQDKADKERSIYQELKTRYEDPESKVFHNEWFAKNHLNPAWDVSTAAHEELISKKATLVADASSANVTWLKIFYRLGLVFLCMLLVHRFFAVFTAKHTK